MRIFSRFFSTQKNRKENKPEIKREPCKAGEIAKKIEPKKEEGPFVLIREHPGLIFAFIPIGLAIIRVIRVSGMQSPNLYILIETLDVTKLLISTLTEYGPPLIFYSYIIFLMKYYRIPKENRDSPWLKGVWLTLPAASILLLILTPIHWLLALLAISIFYWIFEFIDHKRKKREAARSDLSSLATLMFIFFLISPNTVWLTPREVELKDGETHIGYILQSNNRETVIMTEEERRVTTIKTNSIESATPCSLGKKSPPLATYIYSGNVPKTVECQD